MVCLFRYYIYWLFCHRDSAPFKVTAVRVRQQLNLFCRPRAGGTRAANAQRETAQFMKDHQCGINTISVTITMNTSGSLVVTVLCHLGQSLRLVINTIKLLVSQVTNIMVINIYIHIYTAALLWQRTRVYISLCVSTGCE